LTGVGKALILLCKKIQFGTLLNFRGQCRLLFYIETECREA